MILQVRQRKHEHWDGCRGTVGWIMNRYMIVYNLHAEDQIVGTPKTASLANKS